MWLGFRVRVTNRAFLELVIAECSKEYIVNHIVQKIAFN